LTDETKPTKIAVVRCDIVSETCPGVGCFKAFNERKSHFEAYGKDAQIIAFFTCGGCSGRRVYRLLKALKQYELDAVHLSSCMLSTKDKQLQKNGQFRKRN
jgi:predicted metal-binding protein